MEWLSRASSGALDAQLHLLLFRFFFSVLFRPAKHHRRCAQYFACDRSRSLAYTHAHNKCAQLCGTPNAKYGMWTAKKNKYIRSANSICRSFCSRNTWTHGKTKRKKEKRTNRRAECYLRATAQIFLSRPKEMMWHTLRNCLIYFNTCTARAHMLCALCGVRERCARRGRRRNAMPINPQSCWF